MPRAWRALYAGVSPGLAALAAALAVAVTGGLLWRVRNGRMRAPNSIALLIHPKGRITTASDGNRQDVAAGQALRVTGEQIGHALGERATLLQFSTAFCAPCRATRRILADVAGLVPGVAHVEIDAESRLDLVRELDVWRTPTVLVLAADGGVVRRASGQPRKPDVIAAVGAAVDAMPAGLDRTAAFAPDPGK
jgi:thiol-disulfide isomerase/thioredoxin